MLEFKDEEFCITKTDYELKGILYAKDKVKNLKNKIDIILEKIKGKNNNNNYEFDEASRNIKTEINNLISKYTEQKIKYSNIFYKIKLYTFLEGKYKYYRLFNLKLFNCALVLCSLESLLQEKHIEVINERLIIIIKDLLASCKDVVMGLIYKGLYYISSFDDSFNFNKKVIDQGVIKKY